jgi:hypothetical protein
VKAGKKQWCFTISQSTESDKPNNANPEFSLTSLTIDFWQLFCTPSFDFLDLPGFFWSLFILPTGLSQTFCLSLAFLSLFSSNQLL